MGDVTDKERLTRLETQVESLVASFNAFRDSLITDNGPANVKVLQQNAILATRLDHLEQVLNKIDGKLEKQTFPWATVLTFTAILLTVGGSLGGLFFNQVKGEIGRIDRDVAAIQQQVVPRQEHTDRWRLSERRGDDIIKRIEALERKPR